MTMHSVDPALEPPGPCTTGRWIRNHWLALFAVLVAGGLCLFSNRVEVVETEIYGGEGVRWWVVEKQGYPREIYNATFEGYYSPIRYLEPDIAYPGEPAFDYRNRANSVSITKIWDWWEFVVNVSIWLGVLALIALLSQLLQVLGTRLMHVRPGPIGTNLNDRLDPEPADSGWDEAKNK